MTGPLLPTLSAADVKRTRRDPVDAETLRKAAKIVHDVRERGERALTEHAERLGDLGRDEPLVLERKALERALEAISSEDRGLLERTADRIRRFAEAQRQCLTNLTVDLPGGEAGHDAVPVDRAGCYAPGGRFPLPSTVLMTAVTARVAGVKSVWVASPKPAEATLAAAAVADVDALLCVGGAQAIAALAYGAGPVPPCDIVVGPGNRWVTAAKHLVSGHVGIDMLAGPTELLVLADDSADASIVAADLIAQAEHDSDAAAMLVTTHPPLIEAVRTELESQLADLPTAPTARDALQHGFAVTVGHMDEAVSLCNRLAPEHLEVMVRDEGAVTNQLENYGALFVGRSSAEVFGDYGAGPNHVLPTGGTARFTGGLSVLTFLKVRTWLRMEGQGASELTRDAAALARLEGLYGHARAAEHRG